MSWIELERQSFFCIHLIAETIHVPLRCFCFQGTHEALDIEALEVCFQKELSRSRRALRVKRQGEPEGLQDLCHCEQLRFHREALSIHSLHEPIVGGLKEGDDHLST